MKMSKNYLVNHSKWDPVFELLEPGGDAITLPNFSVFHLIKIRATHLKKLGRGVYQTSQKNQQYTLRRIE